MTSKPGPTHPDGTPEAPTPSASNPVARRGVQRKDWIAVASVVAVVLGLGIYLLVRPTSQRATADETPGQVLATSASTAAPTASSNRGGGVMPPTSADPTSASAASVNDSGGQKATKIGPLGDLARRQADDPMAQGDLDAPVVMVMFADYRCPFCAQFSRTTEPQLVDKYVTSGILRIEWRDMPIFGDQSTAAAIAGRGAAAQGKFFEFTQAVYADAPQKGHADLTSQALVDYAKKAGIPDLDAFTAALDDPAAAKAVAADLKESSTIGVPSTPAFIINGYPLLGAQPLTEFTNLIDTVQTLS